MIRKAHNIDKYNTNKYIFTSIDQRKEEENIIKFKIFNLDNFNNFNNFKKKTINLDIKNTFVLIYDDVYNLCFNYSNRFYD